MFEEGGEPTGDPCFQHNGEGTCIYGLDMESGTLDMGACDCAAAADRCGANGERC